MHINNYLKFIKKNSNKVEKLIRKHLKSIKQEKCFLNYLNLKVTINNKDNIFSMIMHQDWYLNLDLVSVPKITKLIHLIGCCALSKTIEILF